jgi:hypothetical protein
MGRTQPPLGIDAPKVVLEFKPSDHVVDQSTGDGDVASKAVRRQSIHGSTLSSNDPKATQRGECRRYSDDTVSRTRPRDTERRDSVSIGRGTRM